MTRLYGIELVDTGSNEIILNEVNLEPIGRALIGLTSSQDTPSFGGMELHSERAQSCLPFVGPTSCETTDLDSTTATRYKLWRASRLRGVALSRPLAEADAQRARVTVLLSPRLFAV